MARLKEDADGGSGMLGTNLVTIEGRDAKPEEIIAAVMTPPFLSPQRLVVVENLLDRFERRGDDERAGRAVDRFNPLFQALAGGMPPTSVLVFTGNETTARNPMITRLKELGAEDEEYPELKGEPLLRLIREEAAARGIRFRTGPFKTHQPLDDEIRKLGDPAMLLAATVKYEIPGRENEWRTDTLGLANELDKLALFTMGRDATVDEVYEICSGGLHATNFALTDALFDGNLRRALEILAILVRDGREEQALFSIIAGAYRRLAPVIDLVAQGAASEEIGRAMGNAGKYAGLRDAAIRRAKRLGPAGLRAAFEALVSADRSVKQGETKDHDLVLEVLVVKLAGLTANR
jgi:DNA polymerase III subunit delta